MRIGREPWGKCTPALLDLLFVAPLLPEAHHLHSEVSSELFFGRGLCLAEAAHRTEAYVEMRGGAAVLLSHPGGRAVEASVARHVIPV
jgi:hypothetical protein